MNQLEKIANDNEPGKYPVTFPVAASILRKLSGFYGYPQEPTGENHFIEEFRKVCISVQHAEEIITHFDAKFPTLKEIRDQAFNLRARFEPLKPSQEEEWEKQYGPKDQTFSDDLMAQYDSGKISWDKKDRAMWNHLREHLKIQDSREWSKISWKRIYQAMDELGYPLNHQQRAIMER